MISFRVALLADSELLFRWRNDPETRENSIQTEEIPKSTHENWFIRSLSNPDRKIYIALKKTVPVGMVRFDRQNGIWEMSWSVSPAHRRQGIGKAMLLAATDLVKEDLIARLKPKNVASISIATFAGFQHYKIDDDLIIMKRTR